MMWFLFYTLLSAYCTHVKSAPLVTDENTGVKYQGSVANSIEHFQDIKYAYDTSGHRRFAAPEPFEPPSGSIIDATKPGPACPQLQDAMPPAFSAYDEISEDCLSLRISRPYGLNLTTESKLPVVVWLHGGGVIKGSAYDPHFDPEPLLRLSVDNGKPIIYAALNYRMNIFGFARLPLLKESFSLNVGMQDQWMGFEWIKNHIQSFGGDPERITAYGLSAGGTFISLHTMAYGGAREVPFQQAWAMSGPPGTALNISSNATELHTRNVAEKAGCNINQNDEELLKCLRKMPMQQLLKIASEYSAANHPPIGTFTFIPSLDGNILPWRPSKMYREGKLAKGRILYTISCSSISNSAQESTWYSDGHKTMVPQMYFLHKPSLVRKT
jgi:carboxylesterase type B